MLVGHSYGGMVVRLFAGRFPDVIKGMVLIDSSHEDQLRRFGDPVPLLPQPGSSAVVVNVPEVIDLVSMNEALKRGPGTRTARSWC